MKRQRDPIDGYFTHSIIGESLEISLGADHTAQSLPKDGRWIESTLRGLNLMGVATRSLVQGDVARADAQHPVSTTRLKRLRRDVLLVAWVTWSIALWLLFRLFNP